MVDAARTRLSPGLVISTLALGGLYLAHQARIFSVFTYFWPLSFGIEVVLSVLIVLLAGRVAHGLLDARAARVATLLVAAAALFLLNWSLFAPRAYFWVHRFEFDRVAALLRAGEAASSNEYYGDRLPFLLAHLSMDGRASAPGLAAGGDDATPAVAFLPEWFGIPDDAGGYVYVEGEPPADLVVDLYGRPVNLGTAGFEGLGRAQRLGGGWWWTD